MQGKWLAGLLIGISALAAPALAQDSPAETNTGTVYPSAYSAEEPISIPSVPADPYFPVGPTLISIASVAVAGFGTWLKSKQALTRIELEHLSDMREELHAQVKDWIKKQMDEKETEITELRDRVSALEAQLRQLEIMKAAKEAEVLQLQSEIESMRLQHQQEINRLKLQLQQRDLVLQQLKTQVEESRRRYNAAIAQLKAQIKKQA